MKVPALVAMILIYAFSTLSSGQGVDVFEDQKIFSSAVPTGSIFGDTFGYSVDVNGDVAIVGAPSPTPLPSAGSDHIGSAYVYRLVGTEWVEEQELVPSDGQSGFSFGWTVAIEGDVAIVGAIGADAVSPGLGGNGAVYVFRHNGQSWQETQKFTADSSLQNGAIAYGQSVALSGDVFVVGAPLVDVVGQNSGASMVYREVGGVYQFEALLASSTLSDGDNFGNSIAVDDGVVVVGASGESNGGVIFVFQFESGAWTEQMAILNPESSYQFGMGRAVAIDGDLIVAGSDWESAPGLMQGAVQVFRSDGTQWVHEQRLVEAGGQSGLGYGNSVDLSGSSIVVGAFANGVPGVAYSYLFGGSTWVEMQRLLPGDAAAGLDLGAGFGQSVALDGSHAFVGAFRDVEAGILAGAAYASRVGPWNNFIRGDCNNDGQLDVADAVFLLSYLSMAGPALDCQASCDVDNDDALGIVDSIHLLNYLYTSGISPAAPFPNCGGYFVPSSLFCGFFSGCP